MVHGGGLYRLGRGGGLLHRSGLRRLGRGGGLRRGLQSTSSRSARNASSLAASLMATLKPSHDLYHNKVVISHNDKINPKSNMRERWHNASPTTSMTALAPKHQPTRFEDIELERVDLVRRVEQLRQHRHHDW